jgi:hypothetical protein
LRMAKYSAACHFQTLFSSEKSPFALIAVYSLVD